MFGIKPTQVQAIGQGPIAIERIIVSGGLQLSWSFEAGVYGSTKIVYLVLQPEVVNINILTSSKTMHQGNNTVIAQATSYKIQSQRESSKTKVEVQ